MDSAQEDGVASEKKSLHARERDTEANQQRRAAFVEKLGTIAPEKLIFLDESGVTTQMTRAWGRAPKGERIAEATPHGHWQVLTTLGAMSLGGMAAVITVAAATTARSFAPMWSRCCVPDCGPAMWWSWITSRRTRCEASASGLRLKAPNCCTCPPYSPDMNPIEKAWFKLRHFLRGAKARTADGLDQAITEALKTITAENAAAWFRHCGYALQN